MLYEIDLVTLPGTVTAPTETRGNRNGDISAINQEDMISRTRMTNMVYAKLLTRAESKVQQSFDTVKDKGSSESQEV